MRKFKTLVFVVASVMCIARDGETQGFVNLDFESANLTPIPQGQLGGLVPISAGLPGWTGFLGSSQTTQVLQNNESTGSESIYILGTDLGGGVGGIFDG